MKGVAGTPSAVRINVPKPEFKLPSGYDNEAAFLEEMREIYNDNQIFSQDNSAAATEDLTFLVGDQWDQTVKQIREDANKPVLTFNRLPAFVGQVVGSRRLNETEIHFHPQRDEDTAEAELREDIMRAIQQESLSKTALDISLLGTVAAGISNFQLGLEYVSDDVFDQNIVIRPIVSHSAVLWDYARLEPTGKDAQNAFVTDAMAINLFETRYPWATPADMMQQVMPSSYFNSGWLYEGNVRVVDYWRMRTEPRTIMMRNSTGAVVDVTNKPNNDPIWADIAVNPNTGEPMVRDVNRRFAQKYICSATDILAGPYNLPIDRIPIFRVPGWEVWIEEKLHTWGLVRFMKDPQVLHNYWRSVIAERLMLSARPGWIASASAVAGREASWRNSHLGNNSLLIYNDDAANSPVPVPPAQFEQAFAAQAEMTNQDLKDISNIHEANLGMQSNEVSGVALMARQRISDTGTILYHDNQASAMMECGRVANDLMTVVYDTPRVIKRVGKNGAMKAQKINMGTKDSVDITVSKYMITVKTGPSYETKRIEAAENMKALANAMPQILAVAADKIVSAQDWPGADEIAERIRMTLPPFMLKPSEITPAVQQAHDAQAQQQAQTGQMAQALQMAKYMQTMTAGEMNHARAQHYMGQAAALPAQIQNQSMTAASEAMAREITSRAAMLKI